MPRAWRTYQLAHETIRKNSAFFCDDCLDLGANFATDKARERKAKFTAILRKAERSAKRSHKLQRAQALHEIRQKLTRCVQGSRCGTLECPECSRAYQCARSVAHSRFAVQLQAQYPDQKLVFATVVPERFSFEPPALDELNIPAANRWFKDRLRTLGIRGPIVGSIDISWEGDRFQVHWHVAVMTANRAELNKRLKSAFPANVPGIKPVVVKTAYSHGFIPYSHKLIEADDILRRARRSVPDLLLALDRTEPLSTLVILNVRMSTLDGGLIFRRIQQ